jgi:hypothetical protein
MLLHSTSNTREHRVLLLVGMAGIAPEGLLLGGDFGLDDRSQSSDALPGAFVELALYQLDPKASLNLQNELQNIDGIDLKIAPQQLLIVAQVFRRLVLDPQTGNNNLFELLRSVFHGDFSSRIARCANKLAALLQASMIHRITY